MSILEPFTMHTLSVKYEINSKETIVLNLVHFRFFIKSANADTPNIAILRTFGLPPEFKITHKTDSTSNTVDLLIRLVKSTTSKNKHT